MNLYEVDREIEALIDDETGEVADYEEFEKLSLKRDVIIENIALSCKNMAARFAALKNEKRQLEKRMKSAENSLKRLKKYLEYGLNGEKFETAKVRIYSKSSPVVELDDEFLKWAAEDAPELLRWSAPEPDKTKIKERIAAGNKVPYARISKSMSLIIK